MKQRIIYAVIAAGAALGLVSAFLQTLEKLVLLENKDAILACNLNSVFSCTNVLNSWQGSLFGFPNSILCMVLFAVVGSIALVGAMGGTLSRGLRLLVHGLSILMLLFALWFLSQSLYVIGSLCIFCLVCFVGLLLANWGWLRINAADLPIGEKARAVLQKGIKKGADAFGWIVLALVLFFAVLLRFS